MNPLNSDLEGRRIHEWLATVESNEEKTKGVVGFFYRLYINETAKYLKDYRSSLILDVGSGEGVILKDTHLKSIQIDISYDRLVTAKKYNSRLVCADAYKLPFKNNSFECVLLIAILEHVRRPYEIIKEVYRVAKDSAKIVIVIPNDINMSIGRALLLKFPPRYPGHLSFITPAKLKLWLGDGFIVEEAYPLPFRNLGFALGMYYFLVARKA